MLTLKLQANDYELTLLPPPIKLKFDPFPKQSQDQILFQAEYFLPKSCFFLCFLHTLQLCLHDVLLIFSNLKIAFDILHMF